MVRICCRFLFHYQPYESFASDLISIAWALINDNKSQLPLKINNKADA